MSGRCAAVWILVLAVSAAPAWAEHHEGEARSHDHGHEGKAEPGGAAALTEPGEHHRHLDALVGSWVIEGRIWTMPGEDPIPVRGTMDTEWILDGRFLESVYKGDLMGTAFEGRGIDGYDNASRKYIGAWMDTLGTSMAFFEGECDGTGRVRTMRTEYRDPLTGQVVNTKGVTTILEGGGYRYESYRIEGDEEVLDMEMTARSRE